MTTQTFNSCFWWLCQICLDKRTEHDRTQQKHHFILPVLRFLYCFTGETLSYPSSFMTGMGCLWLRPHLLQGTQLYLTLLSLLCLTALLCQSPLPTTLSTHDSAQSILYEKLSLIPTQTAYYSFKFSLKGPSKERQFRVVGIWCRASASTWNVSIPFMSAWAQILPLIIPASYYCACGETTKDNSSGWMKNPGWVLGPWLWPRPE